MPLLVGGPLLLFLFAASAFPWLLILRTLLGHLSAVPASAGGGLLLLFASLCASHLLRANYMVTLIVVFAIAGVVGGIVAVRVKGVFRKPSRYAVALWCPPLLGALVWIGTFVASQFVSGMSRFGWAMNGDALNNLYDASVIVHGNGIALNDANAVQLPAALIAVGLGAGSASSNSGRADLAHQLESFTFVWVLLLAALCIAMGAVIASVISPARTRTVAIVGALGSLLPLTWFVSGLPIQWGYFNVDVILPITLGAWLIYLGSGRHPIPSFVALVGFAILAFTAWTPIAFLIVALAVTIVVRRFRDFRRIRFRYLLPVLIVVAAGAAIAFRPVDIAALLDPNGPLSISGSGYEGFVNLWWAAPFVAVLLGASALLVRRRTTLPATSGALGFLVGAALTSGFMIYMASGGPHELFEAYYPKKYVWIVLIFLGAVTLSLLVGAFADSVGAPLLAGLVAVGLVSAAVIPPGTWPEVVQRQPIVRIAGDYVRHGGEATVREILALTTTTNSVVLWQSGNPDEPIINEWLLLSHGGLVAGNKQLRLLIGNPYFLYRTSGRYTDPGVARLCKILGEVPRTPVVITANPSIRSELAATCPTLAAGATVRITQSLVGSRPSETGENWQTDGIEGPLP